MNAKLLYVALVLIVTQNECASTKSGPTGAKSGPSGTVIVDSPMLAVLDGSIDVTSMMLIVAQFKQLQKGNAKTTKGSIKYKDKLYTLKKLIEIEALLSKLTASSPEKKNEELKLQEGLRDAIQQVHAITAPFRTQVARYKDQLVDVVQEWSRARNREETVLKKWFEVEETQFTAKYLKSFKELDQFLNEFSLLLVDVKNSLPKSTEIFEKSLSQLKEQRRDKEETKVPTRDEL